MFDIDEEIAPAPVRMHGGSEEMAEYLLALGWARIINMGDHALAHMDHSYLLAEVTGEIAEVHVPAGLRRMKVGTTVFGRAVETEVTAASNIGALMMAAHKAAAEGLTHPYAAVDDAGRTGRQLPLHPAILDGHRLCVDPVRNDEHEPWTWTAVDGGEVDPEATDLVWNDDSTDPALRGWYIVLRDGNGEPMEVIGAVEHDARAVLVALYDALPQVQAGTSERPAFGEVAKLAARRLQKQVAESTNDDHGRLAAELLEEVHEHQGDGGAGSAQAPG